MEARHTFAIRAVGVGLAVGIIGNILFYGKTIGLSIPIFTLVMIAAVLGLSARAGRKIQRRNLWVLVPLLFFAVMIAVRNDYTVLALNMLAVLSLGGLLLHYLPSAKIIDKDIFGQHFAAVLEAGLLILPFGLTQLIDSWGWLRHARWTRMGQATAVIRGLVIALPILLVFVILLGSADAVFADFVTQIWDVLNIQNVEGVIEQGFVISALSFVAIGAFGYGIARKVTSPAPTVEESAEFAFDEDDDEQQVVPEKAVEKRKPGFKLGMIEATMVLGSVDVLFAIFVAIQFAYFFGGQANISIEGMTYAQYARRGFFELVAVSGMTLGLALWLDHVTMRQGGRENILFRVLAVAVVALTSVMLFSASGRMLLYEEAFGFTHLRVYTHVAMLWLGVLFGFYLLAVFRVRANIFSLGMLLSTIGYLGTLNVMNVDYYIAERNVNRYYEGRELDINFLNMLSTDAAPIILDLYQNSEDTPSVHTWAGQWLAREFDWLEREKSSTGATIFSANASRDAAWALLDTSSSILPVYDPSYFYGYTRWDDVSRGDVYDPVQEDTRSGWEFVTTATPASP